METLQSLTYIAALPLCIKKVTFTELTLPLSLKNKNKISIKVKLSSI